MAKEKRLGTSAFTHQDDAGAELHTTDPRHQEALHYGGSVPPKAEVEEVIVGPAAFGSPDPRTLGHMMITPGDEKAASAPALDPEFEKLLQSGTATSDQLDEMTKDDLLNYAKQRNIESVTSSMNKSEILNEINAHHEATSAEENEETNYNQMTKAELLNLASEQNLDIDESNTKQEIITALEGNS